MSGNPNTNSQTDAARIPNRDSRPGVPPSAIEVENKLKEAQAKLMEAEGKLMASTPTANARQEPSRSASDRTPNAGSAPRGVDTNDTRAQAPRTEASPNGSSVTREPERKETLGERVGNAAANVSAEMRAHAPAVPPTEHLTENVAATLCYLLGWVSGFVFSPHRPSAFRPIPCGAIGRRVRDAQHRAPGPRRFLPRRPRPRNARRSPRAEPHRRARVARRRRLLDAEGVERREVPYPRRVGIRRPRRAPGAVRRASFRR